MPLTLIAPPGLSDLPDSALDAEEIAQGQHAVKILENTKFGVVRPEFFYMGRFSDGQTVARPTSAVDRLPYQASEVIYLWEVVLSADPRDGITSGAGTILYFDYDVEQRADGDPGLVHCKTVYHVQGGQTTETQDGELSVWAVGVRGLGQLDLAAIPAWTNVPDADLDLDSAWREDRLKDLNAAAKRSVVQAEFFDLGEFGNGQTVPRPTSDVDGFQYPYADLVFLTSWRWTPAFATGLSSGPSGHTLARLEKNVNGATGLVDTTVTYRLLASSDTVTQDGRVRVFAFGFRAGITATGTVSFTDLNANVFLPGKPPLDDDALVMVRNSKFAALRPEFFVTTQTHGTTVALPTSPIDGYAYARAELIYLYARSDTAAPGAIGSLLTLHGFIRQDTGAVTINTLYFEPPKGDQTNTNNGTFRVVTVGLRSKAIEVDSDPGDPGGGEPGFEGGLDNELLSGGGILLMRNPDFESGDVQWTKDTGDFTIEKNSTDAYDGDWVAKFVGSAPSTLRNSVTMPAAPGDRVMAQCFIKRTAGDGSPRVRISWLNASKTEIGSTIGDAVTSSSYARSAISATAPAGTFFARVACSVASITVATTAYFDQFGAALFPIDLDAVPGSPTRSSIDPAYLDGVLRPTLLRRIVGGINLDADDIFRFTGAGAQDADDVAEAATRKWAAESGANITETRTAAAISGQGALATQGSAAWASQVSGRPIELTDGRVGDAILDSGQIDPDNWHKSNSGKSVFDLLASGTTTLTGWRKLQEIDFYVGPDVSSIIFELTLIGNGAGGGARDFYSAGNNIGLRLAASPGSTPSQSRTGSGALTYTNPTTGQIKLALYVRLEAGGANYVNVTGECEQFVSTPFSGGQVT
jgi:hypothetical protein